MPTRREAITRAVVTVAAAGWRRWPRLRLLRDPLALPSTAQQAWQDLELGMFVHFAPNTWQDKEYDDLSLPPAAIMPEVDTEQWADTAVALGARYIVLVAKHTGGFCLWQTKTTDYGISGTPWRDGHGDVMADLAASCARRQLRLGIYLSPRDDRHGAGLSGRCATPAAQAVYDGLYRRQLTELLSRYGPIVELWLDGSSVVPTGDIVPRYASGAMIFQGPQATIRWVGNEDGFAPYPCWNALAHADAATGIATALHGDPEGDVWMPVEVDVSVRRPNWFWSTTDERHLLSLDALLEIYYRSVGRGAQLLLNMPPDRTGRIPAADAERAREFGEEIRRRFGTPVGQLGGVGREQILGLGGVKRVDHVILEEDIARGERVRGYRLDGFAFGAWRRLDEGSAIGHKRIHPIPPDGYSMLRLTVTAAAADPVIRRFAAFNTGARPPATWRDQATLWADDAVGEWSGDSLSLDLSAKLPAAAQYRLRLVARDGSPVELGDVRLTVGGKPAPHLARPAPGRHDVWLLTIPERETSVTLVGRVRGAARGTVLLQRL